MEKTRDAIADELIDYQKHEILRLRHDVEKHSGKIVKLKTKIEEQGAQIAE